MNIHNLVTEWRKMGPAAWSENKYGWVESGQPITLAPWQRAVLDAYWQRRLRISTLFVSTCKKAGKTWLDSLLLCYRWLTIPSVHFCCGNDLDQSSQLQFAMIKSMVERHPILSRFVKATRDTLIFEPTGSKIISLPMDFAGNAGANFATVSITELWGFVYENAQRTYEELTPVPGDCLRIVDSYAGFEGESLLLKQLWDRGLAGERVSDDWPIYLTGRQLSYIHTDEDAQIRCWRGTEAERIAYYEEQQATLRPGTYSRLHLNRWASSESTFIPITWWDRAATAQPIPGDRSLSVVLGVDAGLKRDSAAVAAVAYGDETHKARLVGHRIFYPRKGETLDLEDTLEAAVRDFDQRFRVIEVRFDPWQFMRSSQALAKDGISMQEFPQSLPNLTAMSTNLYELMKGGNLIAYPDADIRLAMQRAVAVETTRGLKISKEKASHRIDIVVAIAIAALGAVAGGTGPSLPYTWVRPGTQAWGRVMDQEINTWR